MKTVKVVATFPGLLSQNNPILADAEATTLRAAISRAVDSVLKSPELKRKRVTDIELKITVNNG